MPLGQDLESHSIGLDECPFLTFLVSLDMSFMKKVLIVPREIVRGMVKMESVPANSESKLFLDKMTKISVKVKDDHFALFRSGFFQGLLHYSSDVCAAAKMEPSSGSRTLS
eukprot:5594303-Amphidinium_carterae.1